MTTYRPKEPDNLTIYERARDMAGNLPDGIKPAFVRIAMLILDTGAFSIKDPITPETAAQFTEAARSLDGARALRVVLDHFVAATKAADELNKFNAMGAELYRGAIIGAYALIAADILTETASEKELAEAHKNAKAAIYSAWEEYIKANAPEVLQFVRANPFWLIEEVEHAETPEAARAALLELKNRLPDIAPENVELYRRFYSNAAIEQAAAESNPEEKARLIDAVTPIDSGLTVINKSPATKALMEGKTGCIYFGTNPDTGNRAEAIIKSGFLTVYEKEVLECISKFKIDGQITNTGKIWFTLGQLYRSLRHGAGTQSPTEEQKKALLQQLAELSSEDRKIEFRLTEALKVWGGFEATGGRIRILGFDELYGKIRGQEDILIILDQTPILNALSENVFMYERPPQEVKAIQEHRYTLELKEPITINGKAAKRRSFTSNEARRSFCKKHGITTENIAKYGELKKPVALSENRIALRGYLQTFVFGYISARAAGTPYSNKMPYSQIFEACKIKTSSRESVKRAKEFIALVLDHYMACAELPELKRWEEYTNKGSRTPDGIQIFVELPESGAE